MSRPRLIMDIETNGFLDACTTIHCLVLQDAETGEQFSYGPGQIEAGLQILKGAGEIIGHNIIGFDIPVIRKLYPRWDSDARLVDTLVLARLIFGDMLDRDMRVREARIKRGLEPPLAGNLLGSHKLEAWGFRLGQMKGDYSEIMKARGEDPWAKWNPMMQEYCEQDVRVTAALLKTLEDKGLSGAWAKAADIELRFAVLVQLQERHGFAFDVDGAAKLEAALRTEKAKAEDSLHGLFPPWWVQLGEVTPAEDHEKWIADENGGAVRTIKELTGATYTHTFKNGKTQTRSVKRERQQRGYYMHSSQGGTYQKVELRVFNPSSRQHIADRLMTLYGWKPEEFTPAGTPVVDDEILSALPYPPAQALAKYFMLEKRLGQLADGRQAWLKLAKQGRIHGRVNTLGAVTGRCTHSDPNVAQVPSVANSRGKVPYGSDCRALFIADPGHVLVGCDADGLELRCLAHFMRDGGRYAQIVDEGKKEDGTDIHTMNQKAAGLDSRANAKTFISTG